MHVSFSKYLNNYVKLCVFLFLFTKELEQKLSRQDEATGVAMVMQTQLAKYRQLEKENAKLNDDNHYYRY